MRLLIDVYLQSQTQIRTDVPALGAWDTEGVSEELDFSLPQFPKANFISAKSTAGKYGVSVDGAYSWRVQVPNAAQIAQLNLTQFPSVFFFDLDAQKYVAKIEGTPQGRGVIADLLRGVFTGANKPVTAPGAIEASLWILALLLFAKIKKTTA